MKPKKSICPECGKKYIEFREYTDGSAVYIHEKKTGSFGITELTKVCFIKKATQ